MFNLFVPFLLISSAWSLYDDAPNVIELTPANFDKMVLESDGVWMIEFYAPWCHHCQELAEIYIKVANVLRGIVKVGALDVDHFKDFGRKYDIRGFPTIIIFGLKKRPRPYDGARTIEGLVDAALNAAKTKVAKRMERLDAKKKSKQSNVVELTADNFDSLVLKSEEMWMVEFYAPWCGHCKNLAPEWSKAATALKGKVKLGALDCIAHTFKANEYAISGYPTIKVFPSGVKNQGSAVNYEGMRTADSIISFALDLLRKKLPPPEIKELTDRTIFDKCAEKMLCVISILPHILDCQSSCRNGYLGTLRSMGDNFRSNDWGWVWAEAGSQPELEEALTVGGFGYPTLVALNKNKMKYIQMKGSFSNSGIKEFLWELAAGKVVSTSSLDKSIPKVRTIAPWNGEDAEYPKEDDQLVGNEEKDVAKESDVESEHEAQLEKTTEVKDEL